MNNSKRILLAAGGTGGHFFPALATATELHKEGFDVHFSTDKRCKKYIPSSSNINFKIIDLYIRTGSKLALMLLPIKLTIAFTKAMLYIAHLKPSLIIGFGGYPSFPTLLACRLLSVPIILHEQNRFLGKVNRFFARNAKLVAFSYEKNKQESSEDTTSYFNDMQINSEYVGDIVRENIRNIKSTNDFTHNPMRILVFGGSQGAKVFTHTIPEAMNIIKKTYPDFTCNITQQASLSDKKHLTEQYEILGFNYKISDFFHNIDELYKETDLVISRSGASTIAELSAVGLPAIFIPFPYAAENHQYENAKFVENIGGGWAINEDKNLAQNLASRILTLNNNRDQLKEAATNIASRKSDGITALVATVKRIVS